MCIILFILILCVQKFREEAQKAKMESERLQNLLLEKEVDAEMCKRELEMQKAEIANLNQRISEVSFSPLSNSVMTKYHEIPLALLRTATVAFGPKQVLVHWFVICRLLL